MLIRKNTKLYKSIAAIVEACQGRADREKLIRLYITRAGHTIHDRISVEGIQGDAALFYEMNFQTVLNNLSSPNHQLQSSDDTPGIYYFHSVSNKSWDEAPFEFDEAVKKEFSSLPELPVVRKKEKTEKFVFPSGKQQSTASSKKEKPIATVKAIAVEKGPRQPAFKLKHKFEFTDLDKIIFRKPDLTKRDILEYYNKIAEHLLPSLRDRSLQVRFQSDRVRPPVALTEEALLKNAEDELPDWIKPTTISQGKEKTNVLLCNDKEHLLYYVEKGCLEFIPSPSRVKSFDTPDYIILALDLPDGEQASEVIGSVEMILKGLQLPSFLKSDGVSGLHVYIPLDSKSTYDTCEKVAEYICRLIALKKRDYVSLSGIDEYVYGRVSLDFSLNKSDGGAVAPYSIVIGEQPSVAIPIQWEDVALALVREPFNEEKILKRLKQADDPFEAFYRKKINAESLLERLEENYGFLF